MVSEHAVIENVIFISISSTLTPCCIESETRTEIKIVNCCFKSLVTGSSGHAGAVYLKNVDTDIRRVLFEDCRSKASTEDFGSNAFYATTGSTTFEGNTIIRCSDTSSTADSSVYFNSPENIVAIENNFSKNAAAQKNAGSSSIEINNKLTSIDIKFITDFSGSGRRSMNLWGGTLKFSNIINFTGVHLFSKINEAESCCFFGNTLSSPTEFKAVGCFSDDSKINGTTVSETRIRHNTKFADDCIIPVIKKSDVITYRSVICFFILNLL